MPRMSNTLGDTVVTQAIPKSIQTAHVKKMDRKLSKKTQAPMRELTWEIEEGEYAGRELPYDIIMVGGFTEAGAPMPLFRLIEFIDCASIPWTCTACGTGDRIAHFLLGTGPDLEKGENGLERGKYHCPDCKAVAVIDYDDDNFLGARCKLDLITEIPEGRDRPVNRIKRYLPIA